MKKKAAGLLVALVCLPALGQTWFKVAVEPNTVATTGQTWRYGIAVGTTTAGVKCPCWSPSFTTALTGKSISDASNGFLVPDPAPGVAKELDVLETSAVQTVTVNGAAVTVPALPPPPSTNYTVTCTATLTVPPAGSPTMTDATCTAVLQ